MSAIIAGNSCKKCKKPYYLSLGHPKWYDDSMKRRLPKSDEFLKFEKMALSGMCPRCYMEENKECLPMKDVLVACFKRGE
jgi:hypothetical protein